MRSRAGCSEPGEPRALAGERLPEQTDGAPSELVAGAAPRADAGKRGRAWIGLVLAGIAIVLPLWITFFLPERGSPHIANHVEFFDCETLDLFCGPPDGFDWSAAGFVVVAEAVFAVPALALAWLSWARARRNGRPPPAAAAAAIGIAAAALVWSAVLMVNAAAQIS